MEDFQEQGGAVNFRKRLTLHYRTISATLLLSVLYCSLDYCGRPTIQMWMMSFAMFILPYWIMMSYISQYMFLLGIVRDISHCIKSMIEEIRQPDARYYVIQTDSLFMLEFLRKNTHTITFLVQDSIDLFGFVLVAEMLATILCTTVIVFEYHQFDSIQSTSDVDVFYAVCSLVWILMELFMLFSILSPQSSVRYEVLKVSFCIVIV